MIDQTILSYIADERQRQLAKWGEQHLPDGTGRDDDKESAKVARALCDMADLDNRLTWRHILREEMCEAMAESDLALLKAELTQVAAVCVAWIRDIESRQCPVCLAYNTYAYEVGSGETGPDKCRAHQ